MTRSKRMSRGSPTGSVVATSLATASMMIAAILPAAPEYWVDNEWIRVTAEERRETPSGPVLALQAECKQQGFPEYIVTHLDDSGTEVATGKSGKYCPREGAAITFLLPLPTAGSYRIEFNRIEGAM